jgi:two-component system chemotaxis response regulator CheY
LSAEPEVRVNYLVVESSLSVRESLCYVLLSFGIKGIPVENRQAARLVLGRGDPVEGVIVDIDNKDVEGIQLVAELKEGEQTRRISVIVHTIQTSKEAVMRMVDLGVAGYLLKPFTPEAAKSKLAAIFSKLATHDSQRKHIRVKPDPQELARVSFRVPPSSQLVAGRVVDISLGGMAAELFNLPPTLSLAAGMTLTGMEISLSGKELNPSTSVVLYKLKVLAVRFEILTPTDKKALERYIFKSISS